MVQNGDNVNRGYVGHSRYVKEIKLFCDIMQE